MGATDGMIALQEFISENLWILLSAVAIYFYIGLVLNIAEIQFTTSIGYQIGRSHAIEQAVGLTIMLGLAAAANELAPAIQDAICAAVTGGEGGTAGTIVELWQVIARLVVTLAVSGTMIWVAISATYSGLGMQISHMMGAPNSVSESLVKLITILVGGALTLLAAWGANLILDIVFLNH